VVLAFPVVDVLVWPLLVVVPEELELPAPDETAWDWLEVWIPTGVDPATLVVTARTEPVVVVITIPLVVVDVVGASQHCEMLTDP